MSIRCIFGVLVLLLLFAGGVFGQGMAVPSPVSGGIPQGPSSKEVMTLSLYSAHSRLKRLEARDWLH
jgi:hypothetical protein